MRNSQVYQCLPPVAYIRTQFSLQAKVVALKRVDKGNINIRDRDILLELKQVRELSHENVNPFVGASVEAPNVYILMLYANKGSLQDALQNDHINLSWDFKISFATDIAKVTWQMYVKHIVTMWIPPTAHVSQKCPVIVSGHAIFTQQSDKIPRETNVS